ncbi:hypothetical protein [Flavihumibacter petaseus]|uniref:Tetratricopeptide repeat protein n=1 Tax=Flavihumibacter petaseus NBRC 106054 TaxID=1220578 RepID=A0A0E9MXT3_9BACT|nr:hypothetical protein [Flavihumibacter petaseus]GAO42527.1 hypothetical protein FPE01S_01_15420 [Flavihumibacter petaseus NBRC 106054]
MNFCETFHNRVRVSLVTLFVAQSISVNAQDFRPVDKKEFKQCLKVLDQFDTTDVFKNYFCENASERIGDYYHEKGDFLKAIAYYDSADNKYRNAAQFCGNGDYIFFVPRKFKVSKCYKLLGDTKAALAVITPLVFDEFISGYVDSTMLEYYVSLLYSQFTREEIRKEIQITVNQLAYITEPVSLGDGPKDYIKISCTLKFFEYNLEFATHIFKSSAAGSMPLLFTRTYYLEQVPNLPIYKRIME